MSESIIEPSDTERSEWPDTTREYVEAIEANTEQLERELAEATKMLCNETTRANANAALVAEARALCRDLYAYAAERTPDSRNTCPYTEFGKLRTRLRAMECK